MNQRVDLTYNCEAVVEFQIVLLRLERKLSLPHVQDPAGANVFQGPSHVIGFLSPEPCTLASQRFMGVILCASTPSWVLPIWVGVFESYHSTVCSCTCGPICPNWSRRGAGTA